ncbi:hypothetical protein [Pseudotamlana carrageenivorans]|uniref:Uncharacterized protein n=1 Tax=Pseudotamlana carrageenivorans TaxID=2069432 RepID=A0A2I7SKR5_9FLAO|nr:hypothetical protein [Tamlana carrageenivorans]AUS06491.1 hypothetical protein C1A40_14015 [Tamlana carrageenivorans]
MAKVSLTTIKNWFKTGLKPTQAQFWDTWDSFRHKDDKIPNSDVDGLAQLLSDKASTQALTNHTNDANAHAILFSEYTKTNALSKVATSNDYNDLDNVPVFKSVENEYPDMATMYADQVNQTSENIQHVVDASAHPQIGGDSAYFEYLGTTNGDDTDYRVLSEAESAPISGSISRTSELVNDGASGTSTYVEHDELNPTAIDGLSIRDANGVEQFKADEFVEFVGGEFDPANKRFSVSPLLANSVLVDVNNGSDTSGELENFRKPFKTIDSALEALPSTTGEVYNIYLVGGTYNLTRQITLRNLNFIAWRSSVINFTGILDGTGNVPTTPFKGASTYRTLSFEGGNISLISTNGTMRFGGSSQRMILKGSVNELKWQGAAQGLGNGAFFIDGGTDINIQKMTIVGSGEYLSGDQQGTPQDIIFTINELHFIDNRSFAVSVIATFDIKNVTEADSSSSSTYVLRSRYNDGDCIYKIGNISINGILNISAKEIFFNSSVFSATSNAGISGLVRGIVYSDNYLDSYGGGANSLILDNFTGKLMGLGLTNGRPIIRNSNITTNGSLFTGTENTTNIITIEGVCSIIQNNLSANLCLTYSYGNLAYPNNMHIDIKGFLTSNVKDYGYKVTYENLTGTLKEKLKERVIRSKRDLVYAQLDVNTTYIIDGDIELAAGEYIEVPAGGNLTLNGYGLEASKIIKNVVGESIFKSPVGGSGGMQIDALKFVMGTPTTSCFDLTDETGFNAVECVKVNFEGSGNLGVLNGYRQGLWTNIGLFGLTDGLTFEGSWVGGFTTNTVIARNLTGTSGILFKKGTALTFASRFTTDGNIDIPAGWSIADFEDANFTNPNTLQVQGAIITRAGVIDDTDTLLFPNIDEEDTASDWRDNIGCKNSSLSFEKLKSPDGSVWKVEVDNTGAIITTAI